MLRIHNEENKKYINKKVLVPQEGQTIQDLEEGLLNKMKTKTSITL